MKHRRLKSILGGAYLPVFLVFCVAAVLLYTVGYLPSSSSLDFLIPAQITNIFYVLIATLCLACLLFYRQIVQKSEAEQDTSAEIKTANRLLESRLAAMEQSFDGIFIVRKDEKISYMNQRLVELYEINQKDVQGLIGQDWLELFSLETQSVIREDLLQELYEEGTWSDEFFFDEEHEKYIELSITKLPDGGLIGASRDLSAKKKADEEKKEANEHHTQLQAQFYQAQKMEAIGRLAGGIAHDFNNILAAINGYSEFLLEDLSDRPTEQKFANKILNASQQAKKLVDQILTFSRKNDAKHEVIDIIPVLSEVVSMVKASAIGTIEICQNIHGEQFIVDVNSTQISQAIMNLCVNALDAMEDDHGVLDLTLTALEKNKFSEYGMYVESIEGFGGGTLSKVIEIDEERTVLVSGSIAKDRGYLRISVRDTGTGMSRLVLKNVFEPFFTTKAVDKGTGLGLATVHGVILQHNGAMVIDSTVGEGTRFDILLPISILEAIEEDGSLEKLRKFEFEGVRLLFVEDQEHVRDMAVCMLLRMGFDVIQAADGLHALDILRKHQDKKRFDLVLTDHSMPHMTGLELALEAAKEFPDLPFVLLSGYSEEKLQDIMVEHSCIKDVLRKPIAKEELKERLYRILLDENVISEVDPLASAT